jgi:hypothetical protein
VALEEPRFGRPQIHSLALAWFREGKREGNSCGAIDWLQQDRPEGAKLPLRLNLLGGDIM